MVYKCDYHIVWVPKYRFRILKDGIRELVEKDIRLLCEWKGCGVEELNVREDHVHLMVDPAKSIGIGVDGYIKRKAGDKVVQELSSFEKEAVLGKSFSGTWLFCEYYRLNEDVIRWYVKYQEDEERKEETQGTNFELFEST